MTRILIADDNEQNLYLLRVLLTGYGYEVVSADNGAKALEMARRDPPDMIITDILMPVMDGFALCREWKQDAQLKAIPFIFYTATYTDSKDEAFALGLGAERFVIKPAEPDVLMGIVQTILAEQETDQSGADHERTGNNEAYSREYSGTLVRKLEAKIEQLGVSNRALELEIKERAQAEEALRTVNRAYRTLSDCNQVLIRAQSEPALLQAICQTIVEVGGYRLAWVGFAEQDEAKTVRPVARAGHEAGYLDAAMITWDDSERGRGPTGTAIRTGKLVTARHIQTDPDFESWRVETVKRGYASSVSLPLVIGDQVIGALSIYAEESDAFDQQELDLLAELAADLAYGIASLRTREALAQERNLLRTLIDHVPDLIYVKDAEGRFVLTNRASNLHLGVKSVDDVAGKTDFDYYPQELAERFHADDQQVIQSGQPLINREEPNIDLEGNAHWLLTTRVPLQDDQGRVTALVGIGRDITERKRMLEAEYEQRTLAEALAETARILTGSLDIGEVMERIITNVGRVVPHDAADIVIIDQDGILKILACQGYETFGASQESILALRIPVDDASNLLKIAETRQPLIIPDTREDADWVDVPESHWVRSNLGAPILVNEETIGFLNLNSATPGFFTPAHAAKLQAFADQAAIAIQNARLYDALEDERNSLEQRVTERTAQLNHARERTEAILNGSTDIIILCLPNGKIDQVNPIFDRTFHCEPDQVYNQPLTTLVALEDVSSMERAFADVVETGQPKRLEAAIYTLQHTAFEADVVLSPIVEHDNRLSGVVCSLRDITRRKEMEARLRKMLKHEMELSELKSRYVSMAAHDLRNPLAVIQSTATLIRRYGDRLSGEKLEERYDNIEASIKVMVDLLDDILTLGKVESGKLSFEPAPLDVIAFCENMVIEMKQVTAASQVINFSSEGENGTAWLDAKLLRHVLGNLLSNAIKYSPQDRPITFAVRCTQDRIIFRVQDQGIGIPEADQQRLFETFHRAINARQFPGTGLGLAIVKQSVELHGGTITFESEEGRGTTFTVSIPQAPLENAHKENLSR
jgi:PAS domain S-box-containing protein